MDTTTRTILIIAVVAIVAKFVFGGKVDKDADVPALITEGALLIDVRTPGEFAGGHIQGAINIPVSSITGGIEKKINQKPLSSTATAAPAPAQLKRPWFVPAIPTSSTQAACTGCTASSENKICFHHRGHRDRGSFSSMFL